MLRCVLEKVFFFLLVICSMKKTFKGLRRTSWHTTKRNHWTTTMWPGKNVLLLTMVIAIAVLYVMNYTFVYIELCLIIWCSYFNSLPFVSLYASSRFEFQYFSFVSFFFSSDCCLSLGIVTIFNQYGSAYNHHFEAYVCFLLNWIFPQFIHSNPSTKYISHFFFSWKIHFFHISSGETIFSSQSLSSFDAYFLSFSVGGGKMWNGIWFFSCLLFKFPFWLFPWIYKDGYFSDEMIFSVLLSPEAINRFLFSHT